MSRRRSTVHDVAALRLHPSGVRVPLASGGVRNPTSSVITAKNRNPSLVGRDVRGNWIAMDAGGNGRVTKRRKVHEKKGEVPEDGSEEVQREEVQREENVESQEGGVPAKVFKDARTRRRVAFENDFEFLAEPTTPGSSNSTPQPSSDFLKCIHHFASQYYASSGQLFDSAAQYRKEKKEKQQQRMLQAEASSSENAGSSVVGEESHDEAEDDSISQRKDRGKGKAKAKVTRTKVTQRDMYKAFDGSALLCIGMLLQSHILSSLPKTRGLDPSQDDVVTDDVEKGRSALRHSRKQRSKRVKEKLPVELGVSYHEDVPPQDSDGSDQDDVERGVGHHSA